MKKRLKIAVIGLGNFGNEIVKNLYEMGHEVIAIDNRTDLVQEIQPYATIAITLDATDKDSLEEASLANVDIGIISIGKSMESSILATLYSKEIGVKHVIVKALSQSHEKILKAIGADEIIFPEKEMARTLASKVGKEDIFQVTYFSNGFAIIEMKSPEFLTGKSLIESKVRNKYGVFIVGIKKPLEEQPTLLPSPEIVIEQDDILIVMGEESSIKRFQEAS